MRRIAGGLVAGLIAGAGALLVAPAAAAAPPSAPSSAPLSAPGSIWATSVGRSARYLPAGLQVGAVGVSPVTVVEAAPADPVVAVRTADCAARDRARRVPASVGLTDSPSTLALVAPGGRVVDTWTDARRCGASVGGRYAGRIRLDGLGVALGGSVPGLPGPGGALTAAELAGRAPVRHALAVLVPARLLAAGSRWPAVRADGTQSAVTAGSGLRLGALLALRPAQAAQLRPASAAGRRLVAALRDHGAYVAGVAPGDALDLRVLRPAGATTGGSSAPRLPPALRADLLAAAADLSIVDDNAPASVGGRGVRRVAAAAPPAPATPAPAPAPAPPAPPGQTPLTSAAYESTLELTVDVPAAPPAAVAGIVALAVALLVVGLHTGRAAVRAFAS